MIIKSDNYGHIGIDGYINKTPAQQNKYDDIGVIILSTKQPQKKVTITRI